MRDLVDLWASTIQAYFNVRVSDLLLQVSAAPADTFRRHGGFQLGFQIHARGFHGALGLRVLQIDVFKSLSIYELC